VTARSHRAAHDAVSSVRCRRGLRPEFGLSAGASPSLKRRKQATRGCHRERSRAALRGPRWRMAGIESWTPGHMGALSRPAAGARVGAVRVQPDARFGLPPFERTPSSRASDVHARHWMHGTANRLSNQVLVCRESSTGLHAHHSVITEPFAVPCITSARVNVSKLSSLVRSRRRQPETRVWLYSYCTTQHLQRPGKSPADRRRPGLMPPFATWRRSGLEHRSRDIPASPAFCVSTTVPRRR